MIWNKKAIIDYLNKDIWDKIYSCKVYIRSRTIDQNARYWAILNYISKETWNDSDYLHSLMKKKYLSKRKQVKIYGKKLWVFDIKSTTKLNTKQFSEYNEKVEQFFRDFWIVVPFYWTREFQSLMDTYS